MPPNITAILAALKLPAGVNYDGIQEHPTGGSPLLQFTDRDPASPAYGASFYVPATSANTLTVTRAADEKRQAFSTSSNPLPKPCIERRYQRFPGGDYYP